MLKKSASFVLAALGGSTYRTEYAFASSLAAAALDGLFDHPAGCSYAVPDPLECCVAPVPKGFFNNLLVGRVPSLTFLFRLFQILCLCGMEGVELAGNW
ncbi:MAG: hypothetical protein VST66_05270 [Nitrospirota bacterium]|nr:hypothetical protein [Nitrospirota bacterium]